LGLLGRGQLLSSHSFQGGKMAYRAICVALLLSSLPIAGCGTVTNLARPGPEWGGAGKSPFGGVREDVSCIKNAAHGDVAFASHPNSESVQHPQVAVLLCCAADLPFSLIGDVVTWPYTASYSFINQPVPVPPVVPGPPTPPAPVAQAPAQSPPESPPSEELPQPRKLP
jgi:hypothetical protein